MKNKIIIAIVALLLAATTATMILVFRTKLTGIEISANPTKTVYSINEELDLSGGAIKASYSNKSTKVISLNDKEVTVTGFSSETAGEKTITVKYKNKTTNFKISVLENSGIGKVISSISGLKTEYEVGDILFKNNQISLKYSDGAQEDINLNQCTISGFNTKKAGEHEVTIKYNNSEYTYTINVQDSPVVYVELYLGMVKTVYNTGEQLDISELYLIVCYENQNASFIEVTPDMIVTEIGAVFESQTIKISYLGFELTYQIDVLDNVYENFLPVLSEFISSAYYYELDEEFIKNHIEGNIRYSSERLIFFATVYNSFSEEQKAEIDRLFPEFYKHVEFIQKNLIAEIYALDYSLYTIFTHFDLTDLNTDFEFFAELFEQLKYDLLNQIERLEFQNFAEYIYDSWEDMFEKQLNIMKNTAKYAQIIRGFPDKDLVITEENYSDYKDAAYLGIKTYYELDYLGKNRAVEYDVIKDLLKCLYGEDSTDTAGEIVYKIYTLDLSTECLALLNDTISRNNLVFNHYYSESDNYGIQQEDIQDKINEFNNYVINYSETFQNEYAQLTEYEQGIIDYLITDLFYHNISLCETMINNLTSLIP